MKIIFVLLLVSLYFCDITKNEEFKYTTGEGLLLNIKLPNVLNGFNIEVTENLSKKNGIIQINSTNVEILTNRVFFRPNQFRIALVHLFTNRNGILKIDKVEINDVIRLFFRADEPYHVKFPITLKLVPRSDIWRLEEIIKDLRTEISKLKVDSYDLTNRTSNYNNYYYRTQIFRNIILQKGSYQLQIFAENVQCNYHFCQIRINEQTNKFMFCQPNRYPVVFGIITENIKILGDNTILELLCSAPPQGKFLMNFLPINLKNKF
jgi:hypothetical protein